MSGTGNHDASDSDLSHLTSGWPGAPGVRGVPLTGNADGTSDSKYAQAQAATMAGPNAPLSSPLFSPLFPSFPPPFPFFYLCYSKIRTHRYREIAIKGYCTNTVGVQLTGGKQNSRRTTLGILQQVVRPPRLPGLSAAFLLIADPALTCGRPHNGRARFWSKKVEEGCEGESG